MRDRVLETRIQKKYHFNRPAKPWDLGSAVFCAIPPHCPTTPSQADRCLPEIRKIKQWAPWTGTTPCLALLTSISRNSRGSSVSPVCLCLLGPSSTQKRMATDPPWWWWWWCYLRRGTRTSDASHGTSKRPGSDSQRITTVGSKKTRCTWNKGAKTQEPVTLTTRESRAKNRCPRVA